MNPISSTTRESLAVPRGVDAVLLVVALTGISFSGPLMAATAAPALAIAFWRTHWARFRRQASSDCATGRN